MSYYSDVAVVLCKEAAEVLREKLAEATEYDRQLFDHPTQHEVDEETGDELFRWEQVKWYYGQFGVGFAARFLGSLEPDNYLLVRIGEAYNDTEFNGDYWNNAFGLDVSTRMVIKGEVL